MAELAKDVDAIVNFAAETHVDRSISNNYGPYQFPEKLILSSKDPQLSTLRELIENK